VGFLADVFTGARSVVRGIAALPAAVASRIGRAHQLSEQRESDAQEQFSTLLVTEESKAKSVAQLDDILNELQAQGIPVRIYRLHSGQIAISLVRPELEDVAPEIAANAVAGYIETMPLQESVTERLEDFLNTPLADAELSVRNRDILQKMGVKTLGDLTRIKEQVLLQNKHLGEISLVEIREMLASKGLEFEQFADKTPESTDVTLSRKKEALLDRPTSDLNLSVRARKCLLRLQVSTIGELVRKSADQLLEVKNLGITSLTEIRDKLEARGLKLNGD
jgi:DNA-directed RNA polymerase alpha subunit